MRKKDRRPKPEVWHAYMQYLASDGVTLVTEVVIYADDDELDRKSWTGLRHMGGLMQARAHVLAWTAAHSAAAPSVPPQADSLGDIQLPLPTPGRGE